MYLTHVQVAIYVSYQLTGSRMHGHVAFHNGAMYKPDREARQILPGISNPGQIPFHTPPKIIMIKKHKTRIVLKKT